MFDVGGGVASRATCRSHGAGAVTQGKGSRLQPARRRWGPDCAVVDASRQARPAGRTEQLACLCGTGRATLRREAMASMFTEAPPGHPAQPGAGGGLVSLLCGSSPLPHPHTHPHTPVPPTPLVRRRSSPAAGSGHVCLIYMKHEAEADGRARPRHAVCYTTYAFVPLCMSKQKVMYVYEKINCTISFQYIWLYILVSFPFSSLLIRGCELYSPRLAPLTREH